MRARAIQQKMACRDDADPEPLAAKRTPTPPAWRRSGPDGAPSALEGHRAEQQHLARRRVRRPDRPGRMERALDRFLDVCPWPAARLRRPFPWGKLQLGRAERARSSPVLRETGHGRPREEFARAGWRTSSTRRSTRGASRPSASSCSTRRPARRRLPSFLVLTWFHPFTGRAQGAESPRAPRSSRPARRRERPGTAHRRHVRHAATTGRSESRARIAGESLKHLQSASPEPPVSLGSTVVPPGRIRFRHECFVASRLERGPRATREIASAPGPRRQRRWPSCGAAGPPEGSLSPAHLGRRAAEGRDGRDHRKPPRVSLRALPSVRHRAMCPRWPERSDARWPTPIRDGQMDAALVGLDFLHWRPRSMILRVLPWTTGRRAVLVQLRGPRGAARRRLSRVLRTARRERVSRPGRSAPAGDSGYSSTAARISTTSSCRGSRAP